MTCIFKPFLLAHSVISFFTSFPKSSCSVLKSSTGPELYSTQSVVGMAGVLWDTRFALLLGQSLGDLLLADGKVAEGGTSGPSPAPAACAGNIERVEERVLRTAAEYCASARRFGVVDGWFGLPESSAKASENDKEKIQEGIWTLTKKKKLFCARKVQVKSIWIWQTITALFKMIPFIFFPNPNYRPNVKVNLKKNNLRVKINFFLQCICQFFTLKQFLYEYKNCLYNQWF